MPFIFYIFTTQTDRETRQGSWCHKTYIYSFYLLYRPRQINTVQQTDKQGTGDRYRRTNLLSSVEPPEKQTDKHVGGTREGVGWTNALGDTCRRIVLAHRNESGTHSFFRRLFPVFSCLSKLADIGDWLPGVAALDRGNELSVDTHLVRVKVNEVERCWWRE